MALPKWTEFNKSTVKKSFEVVEFVSAFHYLLKPYFEPYDECYDFSQIFLVLEGEGVYRFRGKTYDISKGMMFYRPSNEKSRYEWISSEVSFALISFVCKSDFEEVFCEGPIKLYAEEQAALLDVIKTGERIYEPIKENEEIQGLKLRGEVPCVVLSFMASSLERFLSMVYCRLAGIKLIIDESGKVGSFIGGEKLVRDVKMFLSENVRGKTTINDVCAHFGVGQTMLMKKFKGETGCGVMEYYTNLKIESAKELIATTSLNFFEISEQLAFSSPSYFSKVFYDKVGMTPTEYSRHVSKRRAIN